jgi:hypothetical protein
VSGDRAIVRVGGGAFDCFGLGALFYLPVRLDVVFLRHDWGRGYRFFRHFGVLADFGRSFGGTIKDICEGFGDGHWRVPGSWSRGPDEAWFNV